MNTPITDDALDKWACGGTSSETIIPAMRRLELDRAALMEALQMMLGCELMGGDQREGLPGQTGTSPVAKARAAISAARANFPNA